ncbi:sensor histidine kinase [Paenibacillus polymyxa]|uniref:cache domain-containing sensor histidine kinase n=1 Tax=Paenibacillus polymyxa TaxID=1406 RepID=UPI000EEA2786|nr:sensor histidine kinase [Paenibacillus polymyxa]RGL31710.1 sensor histidine kinase [Paenibacillus polymyxa]UMR36127.1 sensor histidine kinase [Paenibacillus polymyxa]
MKRYIHKIKYQGLFFKIFIVMVVSITAVSLLTSLVTIRMSERLFAETFSITNAKVLSQIQSSFESFNDSIVNAVTHASENGTVKNYLTSGQSDSINSARIYFGMAQQMKQIKSNVDAYDVGVAVTGLNGRSFYSDSSYWPVTAEQLKSSAITARSVARPAQLMYQMDTELFHQQMTSTVQKPSPYIIASKPFMERTSGTLYGMIYIAIREPEFRRFYNNFTSNGNDVLILDKSGLIVSSNRQDLIGQRSSELLGYATKINEQGLNYINADVMNKESIVLSNYIPSFDFYLVNMIDRQTAVGQIIDVKSVVWICIAIVLIALVIVFLISRRLIRSLTRLVKQMSTIREKNFDNYIPVTGSYEVRQLSHAYNYMLDELNDYIRKLLETQKGQRNAELAALQRQINPHFLYNTLASIKMLVLKGNKETAAETINALISLLQNTISNVSETITIEQEMANMQNYVFINHVRYGQRVQVNYFVSPDCLEYHVPKLIIQPFIENSFFHAFNEKNTGHIYILVSKTEDTLICEVVDDGDGMDLDGNTAQDGLPNPKSKRQLFTGIGIQNVHNRITLLYGEEYGVTISSKKGEGTKVRMTLPLIVKPAPPTS